MSRAPKFEVCVVGGGLVGLATARALLDNYPFASLLLLEKEPDVGRHQSSHNSGVVHSGLYYKPGSLKARLCVEGRRALVRLCEDAGIPFNRSGKVVIATDKSELPALEELERRGGANGLEGLQRVGPDGIRDLEPAATGIAALHVPEAGVTDFPAVAELLARQLIRDGVTICTSSPVDAVRHDTDGVTIRSADREWSARVLVNCAGLHSDRIAAMAGLKPSVRIVPFRGEYYRLRNEADGLVRGLIYPVPDPRFPFLGVHFTRGIDSNVEVGPNAVLALGREYYRGAKPDWAEVRSILRYPGFRKLARRNLWSGAKEIVNSRSRQLYARLARRLVPALDSSDLEPGGAGVRAQAVDADGKLVDDFVIEFAGSTVHVLNAPSPGATASLAIGRYIAAQVKTVVAL
jgi:L-2-hydroxyglutarate oxidase LhgO